MYIVKVNDLGNEMALSGKIFLINVTSSSPYSYYGSSITWVDVIFVVLNKKKINLHKYNNIVCMCYYFNSNETFIRLYLLIYAGKADEFTLFVLFFKCR